MKHLPIGMGTIDGTCPEYGNSWFDDKGQEWETCPVCGKTGRVYYGCKFISLEQIAKETIEALRKELRGDREV